MRNRAAADGVEIDLRLEFADEAISGAKRRRAGFEAWMEAFDYAARLCAALLGHGAPCHLAGRCTIRARSQSGKRSSTSG